MERPLPAALEAVRQWMPNEVAGVPGGVVAVGSLPVEQQVAHVTERLVDDFAGQVDGGEVRNLVSEAYSVYAQARVQQFVPVLVDRSVRQRLRGR